MVFFGRLLRTIRGFHEKVRTIQTSVARARPGRRRYVRSEFPPSDSKRDLSSSAIHSLLTARLGGHGQFCRLARQKAAVQKSPNRENCARQPVGISYPLRVRSL